MGSVEPSAVLLRVVAVATTVLLALSEQHVAAVAAVAAYVAVWLLLHTPGDRST